MTKEKNTTKLVDTFMDLGEKMAELKKAQDAIKAEIVKNFHSTGDRRWMPEQFDGTFGYVMVSTSERNTVNWKGIATKLGASNQMIAGNTKTTEYVKVTGYMYNKKSKVA